MRISDWSSDVCSSDLSDDLVGIYDAIKENALLAKYAGGLGNDWTPVRALRSHIKGTNGESQGVVPFLKVVNDTPVAVNQGGKRKGAVCAYLETWHLDVRSEEHTSELQPLMRISYAVFCLKHKTCKTQH